MSNISKDAIANFSEQLASHPIYEAIKTAQDLQCFMQHHVYSVWDFMSLIKYLQSTVAPTQYPWLPTKDASIRRFINELVLEEECDTTIDKTGFISHFELYQAAMKEVSADTSNIESFIQVVANEDINAALKSDFIPKPSAEFTTTTFKFIEDNKPHQVAAALALGREHIIPPMFRSILSRIQVDEQQAPIFHYYLNRHVHLDEDFHAPLSLKLLNSLCHDQTTEDEALIAAELAVQARLALWDGVLGAIQANQ